MNLCPMTDCGPIESQLQCAHQDRYLTQYEIMGKWKVLVEADLHKRTFMKIQGFFLYPKADISQNIITFSFGQALLA